MAKSNRPATESGDARESKLLTITIDADTARVVRVEGVDPNGARHELSRIEREVILQRVADGRVEDLVERAFEAGIACVLDDEADSIASDESAEDAELRHELLAPLIKRSAVKRITESGFLDRAILSTLIDHSADQ